MVIFQRGSSGRSKASSSPPLPIPEGPASKPPAMLTDKKSNGKGPAIQLAASPGPKRNDAIVPPGSGIVGKQSTNEVLAGNVGKSSSNKVVLNKVEKRLTNNAAPNRKDPSASSKPSCRTAKIRRD